MGPSVVVQLRLYPDTRRNHEWPRFDEAKEPRLYRIHYEACPVARLYSNPKSVHRPVLGGISIGTNTCHSGTLGGILRNENQELFGVTCGHLAPLGSTIHQPSLVDKATAGEVGQVIRSETPAPFPSFVAATEKNQRLFSGNVDAAIIKIEVPSVREIFRLGRITGIHSSEQFGPCHPIAITGRSSDKRWLEFGGIIIFHNLRNDANNEEYCYERLIQLRHSAGEQPVRPGDSGAWLCVDNNEAYSFAGMVVGGDGANRLRPHGRGASELVE